MEINFRYSFVYDLIYHILAHLKVENASNLYSEAYIAKIDTMKNGKFDNISKSVSNLTKYYNDNFDRLGVINFLPFYIPSIEELMQTLENFTGFTELDKEHFVYPLNNIIKQESIFYKQHWNELFNETKLYRESFEFWIKNELKKYQCLFSYFKKSAVIGMSYSLTCNGRGLGNKNHFTAIVHFPFDENDYKNTFYQILHEYTHQFTDSIIGNCIRMDDGTHDLSENAAILFDYYLIKRIQKNDIIFYLEYINSFVNIDNFDEQTFLSVFEISDEIDNNLVKLVDEIVESR